MNVEIEIKSANSFVSPEATLYGLETTNMRLTQNPIWHFECPKYILGNSETAL